MKVLDKEILTVTKHSPNEYALKMWEESCFICKQENGNMIDVSNTYFYVLILEMEK